MIIDVRGGAEFDSLHIKGSYHVPLPMLSEHTEEFAAKMGTRVVLVCQSGNRAEQARKHLDSVGLASASVLSGESRPTPPPAAPWSAAADPGPWNARSG